MTDKRPSPAFTERVKHAASADGADAAFEMLASSGWTVPAGQDGRCPPGFRIFATADWNRRVLIRDDDGSLWAVEVQA